MDRLGLKVMEVADSLAVSESWVYNEIACGRLPVIKLRPGKGAVRIHPDDLEEFVRDRRGRAPDMAGRAR